MLKNKTENYKAPKNLIAFFLVIFIVQMFSVVFLLFSPNVSHAAKDAPCNPETDTCFKAQVPINGFGDGATGIKIKPDSIGKYIEAIYIYAISIVGIVAAAVIMWSGFSWILAGGNPTKISEARSWLLSALGGLVLAITSYLILSTINPELVKVQKIKPIGIGNVGKCCDPIKGVVPQVFDRVENNKQIYKCTNGPVIVDETDCKVGSSHLGEKRFEIKCTNVGGNCTDEQGKVGYCSTSNQCLIKKPLGNPYCRDGYECESGRCSNSGSLRSQGMCVSNTCKESGTCEKNHECCDGGCWLNSC